MLRSLFLFLLPLTVLFANDSSNLVELALEKIQEALNLTQDENAFTCTSHCIQLPSGPLSYKAITGTLPQRDRNGTEIGKIFFTAYLKENGNKEEGEEATDSQTEPERPLTFIFNGGPGGSSLSMHIAGFGPRRILFPAEGQKPFPPYTLIDNPETLLELSDLVMVDPMGTGYSQAEPEVENWFYGCEADLASISEFVRLFCVHFNFWNAPKYLVGASYGATRICGLAEHLAGYCGIYTKGLLLLSSAIDFSTLVTMRDHPLPDCLRIPTMAATAWFHGRGNQRLTLEETVEYARRFAFENYAPAIFEPTRLSSYEQAKFYSDLAELIGLPVSTIERYQGRITEHTFITEFFASQRILIGGTDSRYKGPVSALENEYTEDPSYRDIGPLLYPSFMHYLQNELDTLIPFPRYQSFNPWVNWCWNYNTFDSWGPPNFMQRLRRSLVFNPNMQIFVGLGYFDLRTPLAATEYSLNHLELPGGYRTNFQIEYYKAGHGFIFDLPSLQKFKKDLITFYAK